jgi:hypothetical protein
MPKRLRLTDDQRRRLAAKGHKLGRKLAISSSVNFDFLVSGPPSKPEDSHIACPSSDSPDIEALRSY